MHFRTFLLLALPLSLSNSLSVRLKEKVEQSLSSGGKPHTGLLSKSAVSLILLSVKQQQSEKQETQAISLVQQNHSEHAPPSSNRARNLKAIFLSLFTIVVFVIFLHQVAFWVRKGITAGKKAEGRVKFENIPREDEETELQCREYTDLQLYKSRPFYQHDVYYLRTNRLPQ